jgi:hypothetical protein
MLSALRLERALSFPPNDEAHRQRLGFAHPLVEARFVPLDGEPTTLKLVKARPEGEERADRDIRARVAEQRNAVHHGCQRGRGPRLQPDDGMNLKHGAG